MSDKLVKWVTLSGKHIPIYENSSGGRYMIVGDKKSVPIDSGTSSSAKKSEKPKKDFWSEISKIDSSGFYGKMKLINKLMSFGVTTLNGEDVKNIFGVSDNRGLEKLKQELEYLDCKVTKVADLFNVELPKQKFTREELNKEKQSEEWNKKLFNV